MSELRIALVAEGKTDSIVIEACLQKILTQSFVLTILQPDSSVALGGHGENGGGWPGVYKWCRQIAKQGILLDKHPTLKHFDLIIIHVDADVAGFTYNQGNIDDMPVNNLPCRQPCPPAAK